MQTSQLQSLQGRGGPSLLQLVLAYRNEALVRRLMLKEKLERATAERLFEDMLKFLYIVGTSPAKERFGPPEPIDEAWHHFILFTKEYAEFCHQHFGKFIHHVPNESKFAIRAKGLLSKTQRMAFEAFGALSPNWGVEAGCVGGSCSSDCTPCAGSTNCQN